MNLAQHINTVISQTDDEFVLKVRSLIKNHKLFMSKYGKRYIWKFTPTEYMGNSLKKSAISGNGDAHNFYTFNKIYHDDIEGDTKALQSIFIYRANSLLETSISLLNKKDYLAAAITVRSLVELTAVSLHHAAMIEGNYKKLVQDLPDQGLINLIVDLPYVREIIEKGIWGTKMPNNPGKKITINQFHITDILKKIASKESNEYLKPMYEFLCEATHPNVMGNFLFVQTPQAYKPNNSSDIIIEQLQIGDATPHLIEKTLGGLSWAILALEGAVGHFEKGIALKRTLFSEATPLRLVK